MNEQLAIARGPAGRFIRVECPRCKVPMIHDGERDRYDGQAVWRCDELVYNTPNGPLTACKWTYHEGDPLP